MSQEKQLARIIRDARKRLGITQEMFAAQLGITQARYSQLETAHQPPSFFMLRKIVNAAGGSLRFEADWGDE